MGVKNFLIENLRDYGVIDYINHFFDFKKKSRYIKIKSFHKNLKGTWICFLPWGIHIKDAKSLNLITEKSKEIIFEGPEEIVNPDPKKSKEFLMKIVARCDILHWLKPTASQ